MYHMYESQGGGQGGSKTHGSHPQSTCGLGNKSTLVQVKNDRDVNKIRVNTLDLQLKVTFLMFIRDLDLWWTTFFTHFVQLYLRVMLEC